MVSPDLHKSKPLFAASYARQPGEPNGQEIQVSGKSHNKQHVTLQTKLVVFILELEVNIWNMLTQENITRVDWGQVLEAPDLEPTGFLEDNRLSIFSRPTKKRCPDHDFPEVLMIRKQRERKCWGGSQAMLCPHPEATWGMWFTYIDL